MEQTIVTWLTDYGWLAILLGSFFFGETVILTAAFLSHQGWWSLPELFLIATVGTVLSDSLVFYLARSAGYFSRKYEKEKHKLNKFLKNLNNYSHHKDFFILLFIKFLYGTRVLFIVFLSLRKINFKKFFLYNTLGTFIWLAVMIILGYSAGTGIAGLSSNIRKIEVSLALLFGLIILVKVFSKWMIQKITNK